MKKTMVAVVFAAVLAAPKSLHAQRIYVKDGWEAFPNVEYQGGDATQPKRLQGMLVLTDSTIALHPCAWVSCGPVPNDTTKPPFAPKPFFTIRLSELKEVASSSDVRGPSAGAKLMVGALAGDRKDEFVGLVYETSSRAEAPTFRTEKTHANAIEAKIRFRLKKLGIDLTAK